MLRVCFMAAQFHPELRDRIQTDIIEKITDVAEAFCTSDLAPQSKRSHLTSQTAHLPIQ